MKIQPQIALFSTLGIVLGISPTLAQTVPVSTRIPVADTTLGTQVSSASNNFTITGGQQRGQNVFHSFQDFSVPTNGSVTFINPADNRAIITRVTGNLFSDIDGKIDTQGANLFLINPNGIVFGANTQLNVGQTFVGSTANGIDFVNADGQSYRFGTNGNDAPLLTINPTALLTPARLILGGGNGEIKNLGTLQTTNPNQYIGLIGGNVSMNGGQIIAPNGRVELGGLSAAGTVELGGEGNNFKAQFPTNVMKSDVSVINQSKVNVSGAGGGDITINAGYLSLLGVELLASTSGKGDAGNIDINVAGAVDIAGGNIFSKTELLGEGKGGKIGILSGSLALTNGAKIETSTSNKGDAGIINVTAKDAISLSNSKIISSVNAGGNGKGGAIDIKSKSGSLTLNNGAKIETSTSNKGDAGIINVTAKDAISLSNSKIISSVNAGGNGKGGAIDIKSESGSLKLTNAAEIETSISGNGEAGKIIVTAKDAISLSNSKIISSVNAGGNGKGGAIDIKSESGSLKLTNAAEIETSISGNGEAGKIIVTAKDAISLSNSKIISSVNKGGNGKGGAIDIKSESGSLTLTNGAKIETSISNKGDAGNVIVKAKDVSLTGASILSTVEAGGEGKSGNINITTESLSLLDSASVKTIISAKSESDPQLKGGKGEAGDVIVTTTNDVSLSGNSKISSSVDKKAEGKGGKINISVTSGSLLLTKGGQIETSISGKGVADDVTLTARDTISLSDSSTISSKVNAAVGGEGRIGNINVTSGSLLLTNDAQIETSTAGNGDAGKINVTAKDTVSLVDKSKISSDVKAGAEGKGGDINIKVTSGSLLLTNDAQIETSTAGNGDAGKVNVTAKDTVSLTGKSKINSDVKAGAEGNGGAIKIESGSLSLTNGSQFTASTFGLGIAGNVTVMATDSIDLFGSDSGLFVSSIGTGAAGNIILTSPKITLDNGGTINAKSNSGTGGNINIAGTSTAEPNLLLLRRGAQISTNASGTQQGGNGGNIIINIPNGFIVSAPNENSDITANAFGGSGGKVTINSQQNFWLSPLSRSELEQRLGTTDPSQLQPLSLGTNDITAISQINPNLSGQVNITPPDIDITAGLTPLPNNVTDPIDRINPNCSPKAIANNSFISVGRGGIPASPKDPLNEEQITANWVRLDLTDTLPTPITPTLAQSPQPIIEAQAWRRDRNGDILLMAESLPNASFHQPQPASGCANR
jgi:filamentous hemagglutinin family protein